MKTVTFRAMEKPNSTLMQSAKESLNGKWGLAIATFLVYQLIASAMQMRGDWYPFSLLVFLVLGGPLAVGISIFTLNLSRNNEAKLEQMFEGFKRDIGNAMLTYGLMMLYILAWTLLFIIPGIIAALSYSMTYYILADDQNIKAVDALNKSKEMMDGYKMKYFRLGLRLFGLALLCILTLGIGFLWLIPYAHVTNAKFYDDIKDLEKLTV
jgi:uncharacterized membrane protein